MTSTPLVTLVSYCSREREFSEALLSNARLFSDLVIVSLGTRLYTGENEDVKAEIDRLVCEDEYDDAGNRTRCSVMVSLYDVSVALLEEPITLHNMARELGVHTAKRVMGSPNAPFWALLLDGDEVPDGPRFKAWWAGQGGAEVRSDPLCVHKMANYWSFLDRRLVAETLEDSVLLAHSDVLTTSHLTLKHPRERDGIYMWHHESPLGIRCLRVNRLVKDDDDEPMFSHYSWVRGSLSDDRGRSALKAKCANWGHRDDRDWPRLIDEAFDGIGEGRWPTHDFVHGYKLRLLEDGSGK